MFPSAMRAGNLKYVPADHRYLHQLEVSRKRAASELAEMTAEQFHETEQHPAGTQLRLTSRIERPKTVCADYKLSQSEIRLVVLTMSCLV
jgi:hypothetical protein